MKDKDLSIVIPVFNEEESIPELLEWIFRVTDEHGLKVEILMVDDGSSDDSWKIIQQHAETGRQVLFLGRREWAYIPGLPLEDSEALLDEIWTYAAEHQNVWKQEWQPGDVIIWDNRRVLHRRDDFPRDSRRLMKRCQVLARAS